VHKKADLRTPYWDWDEREGAGALPHKYAGTAPVHLFFGLRPGINMLFAEGLEKRASAPPLLAEAVRPRSWRLGRRPGARLQCRRTQ